MNHLLELLYQAARNRTAVHLIVGGEGGRKCTAFVTYMTTQKYGKPCRCPGGGLKEGVDEVTFKVVDQGDHSGTMDQSHHDVLITRGDVPDCHDRCKGNG